MLLCLSLLSPPLWWHVLLQDAFCVEPMPAALSAGGSDAGGAGASCLHTVLLRTINPGFCHWSSFQGAFRDFYSMWRVGRAPIFTGWVQ